MAMNVSPFRPYPLPRTEKALIGEVFLLCADIEGLVTSALISEAGLEPTIGITLFASSGLDRKVKDLESILVNEAREKLLDRLTHLKPELDGFIAYRNILAHGVYIGSDGESLAFFSTKKMQVVDQHDVVFLVRRIKHADLKQLVRAGEKIIRSLRDIFHVKQLHEGAPWQLGEKPPSRRARRAQMRKVGGEDG